VTEELFELPGRLPSLPLSHITGNRYRGATKLRCQAEALPVWEGLCGIVDFGDLLDRLLPGDEVPIRSNRIGDSVLAHPTNMHRLRSESL
jgi:hypothetical protein